MNNMSAIEESKFTPVSALQGYWVSGGDIERLQAAGFTTVQSVAFSPKKKLTAVKGISETKADRLLEEAHKLVFMGFRPAAFAHRRRSALVRLTTGSAEVDRMLGGGLELGGLVEIFGEAGSGKSQMCFTLAVTCQLPFSRSGAEGKCLYIDTDGKFSSDRVLEVAKRYQLVGAAVLDNIAYARAYNVDHQKDLLIMGSALMSGSRYALVIVDSVTGLYRSDYQGRGELAARQEHLAQFLRNLLRIADEFDVAVLLTNQMTAKVTGPAMYGSESSEPIGGTILEHASATRLSLKKELRGERRSCRIVKSPYLPDSESSFIIAADGVRDG